MCVVYFIRCKMSKHHVCDFNLFSNVRLSIAVFFVIPVSYIDGAIVFAQHRKHIVS